MADFYQQSILGSGINYGRTLIQARGEVGGHRHVFVNLQGAGKNGMVFPPIGGNLANPFKGQAKLYAGDLCEYSIDGKVKVMKTYLVAKAAEGTEILLVRDGYKHIPFVGDVIMVAPTSITGTGTAVTITGVEKTTDAGKDVWKVTVSGALGSVAKDAVLVEAEAAGSGKKMMVKNPNAFLPCDYDFAYDPATSDSDFYGARYNLTPCLANEDTKVIIAKASPMPNCVKALNKSLVEGWFNL